MTRTRPVRAVLAPLLAALVLHLLTRVTGGGWLSLASAAALVLPLVALVLRPRLDGVQVSARASTARVGDEVDVVLVVRNTGSRPAPPMRLVDSGPGLAPVVVAVPALAAGAVVTAHLRRTALQRGSWPAGQAELSSTAPLGLLRATRDVEVAGSLVVHPARVPVPVLRESAGGLRADRPAARPLAGVGTEVLGLRPWRAGDGRRAVTARASARHGRPVVLERERETGPSLVVLVTGSGTGPAWERCVAQVAALAEQEVRQGRQPVLLATGVTARAALDWCAGLDAAVAADTSTVQAAVRAAGPGGAVVLVAPPPFVPHAADAVQRACRAAGVVPVLLGADGA